MGWLQMSKQELRRVEVLTEVLAGQDQLHLPSRQEGLSYAGVKSHLFIDGLA